jgi:hypothetical protein
MLSFIPFKILTCCRINSFSRRRIKMMRLRKTGLLFFILVSLYILPFFFLYLLYFPFPLSAPYIFSLSFFTCFFILLSAFYFLVFLLMLCFTSLLFLSLLPTVFYILPFFFISYSSLVRFIMIQSNYSYHPSGD